MDLQCLEGGQRKNRLCKFKPVSEAMVRDSEEADVGEGVAHERRQEGGEVWWQALGV